MWSLSTWCSLVIPGARAGTSPRTTSPGRWGPAGRASRPPGRRRGISWRPIGRHWMRAPSAWSPSTCPRSCPGRLTPLGWPPPRSAGTSSRSWTPGRPPWGRASPIPPVVDPGAAAVGAGFAVLAAARSAAAGVGAAAVARTARETADATRTFFVVDTLEHLRRGGRIGPAAAVLGSALAVKPVLHVQDGRVVPLEKVRTSARAMNRLVQRAVEAAGQGPVSVAVHHLAAAERAERLAAEIRDRLPQLRELHVSELGPAIGAHVGPGAVGIVVAPFWKDPDHEPRPDPPED